MNSFGHPSLFVSLSLFLYLSLSLRFYYCLSLSPSFFTHFSLSPHPSLYFLPGLHSNLNISVVINQPVENVDPIYLCVSLSLSRTLPVSLSLSRPLLGAIVAV